MERYKTKDLFLHLVSPTIIVILTVIQVHYFHKRFVSSLLNPPTPQEAGMTSRRSNVKSIISIAPSKTEIQTDLAMSTVHLVHLFIKKMWSKFKQMCRYLKRYIWPFMELHLIKLVYLTAFVCAVKEVI